MKINIKNRKFTAYGFVDGILFFRATANFRRAGTTIIHSLSNSLVTDKYPKFEEDDGPKYRKCISSTLKTLGL